MNNSACSNSQRLQNVEENICIICGNKKVIRTSWTDSNPGRRFFTYIRCDNKVFRGWVDPPMCRRSVQIIPGLLRKVNKLETEIANLKAKELKLKVCLVVTWAIVAAMVVGKICFDFWIPVLLSRCNYFD